MFIALAILLIIALFITVYHYQANRADASSPVTAGQKPASPLSKGNAPGTAGEGKESVPRNSGRQV